MISHFVELVIDFIGGHPGLAIFIVFAISMGEALFIIGLFVPSTVVLVSAGTLIGMGQLSFLPIYISATFGAVVGDAVSYWIGHLGKAWIRDVWPFNRYTALVVKGEAYFARHGAKSVFIGRFIPGVKAVVPGIAGMMGMSATRFTIINIVSALFWTAAHILPGMGLGRGLNVAGSANPRLVGVLIALVLLAFFAWYLTRLVLGFILPHLERARAATIIRLNARSTPARRLAIRLLANEEGVLVPLFWGLVALAAAFGLLALTINALFDPALAVSDNAISGFIQNFRTAPADEAMVALTMLGDQAVLATLAAVFIVWMVLLGRFRFAAASIIAFGAAALFSPGTRFLLDRAQNAAFFNGADTTSFPSSHATLSTVIFGVIALVLSHNLVPRWRTIVYATTAAVVAAIGFSRIYLHVHWPSEVAAGLLFGGTIVSVVAFLLHGRPLEIGARWLSGVLLVALLAVYPAHVLHNFDRAVAAYAPLPERVVMTDPRWLSDGWQALPTARILLDGQTGEPFIVQTDLDAGSVEARLAQAGWTKAVPRRVEALLVSAIPLPMTLAERPVLPFYHSGMRPLAEFTMPGARANSRIVLRVWKSAVYIAGPDGKERMVLLISLAREALEPFVFGLSDLSYQPLEAARREALAADVVKALDMSGRLEVRTPKPGLSLLAVAP